MKLRVINKMMMNKVMISKVINRVMINSQRPVALLSHPLRPHRELGDPQKGSPLQGSPCPPPPPPPSSPSQNYSPRSPSNLSSPHLQQLCSSFFPSCKTKLVTAHHLEMYKLTLILGGERKSLVNGGEELSMVVTTRALNPVWGML